MIKPSFFLSYPYSLVVIVDGLDEWDSRPNLSVERSLLMVPATKYDFPLVSQALTSSVSPSGLGNAKALSTYDI